jgi:hypothetical protein
MDTERGVTFEQHFIEALEAFNRAMSALPKISTANQAAEDWSRDEREHAQEWAIYHEER